MMTTTETLVVTGALTICAGVAVLAIRQIWRELRRPPHIAPRTPDVGPPEDPRGHKSVPTPITAAALAGTLTATEIQTGTISTSAGPPGEPAATQRPDNNVGLHNLNQ